MSATPLRLEAVHDPICHWTIIGYTRKPRPYTTHDFENCVCIPDEVPPGYTTEYLRELANYQHEDRRW